jgi:hypothetical protein
MKKLAVVMALVGIICLPALASANTVSYLLAPAIPSTVTDWSLTSFFQQFDPTLGTLNSVELQFSSNVNTDIKVTNNSDATSVGTASTLVTVSAQTAGVTIPPADIPQISVTIPVPAFPFNLASGASADSGLQSGSDSSDKTYTLGPLLAEFTGTGTVAINASTLTQTLVLFSGGNVTAGQVSDVDLTGKVIYDYNAVPVPPTVLLLGSGLLGLVGLRRSRKN